MQDAEASTHKQYSSNGGQLKDLNSLTTNGNSETYGSHLGILLGRKAELESRLTDRSDLLIERGGDDVDLQQATASAESAAVSRNHTRDRIRAIENAIARVKSGQYHECEDCESEILPARRAAAVEATRCVPCQEKQEGPVGPIGRRWSHPDNHVRSQERLDYTIGSQTHARETSHFLFRGGRR